MSYSNYRPPGAPDPEPDRLEARDHGEVASSAPAPDDLYDDELEAGPAPPPSAATTSAIPVYLTAQPRWLLWRTETKIDRKTGGARTTKVPISFHTGKPCDVTAPASWTDYGKVAAALLRAPGAWDGIGFALGIIEALDEVAIGLDLDTCLDANGNLAEWALRFLTAMPSYSEVSPSGTGIKIIARIRLADLPEARRLLGLAEGDREQARTRIFGERTNGAHAPNAQLFLMTRYFATTGQWWPTTPQEVVLLTLEQVAQLAILFGPKPVTAKRPAGNRDDQDEDDTTPGEAALRDKLGAAFLSNPRLKERWEGGTQGLNDPTRSGRDMSIVAMLVTAGFTRGETHAALCWFEHGKVTSEPPRYFGEMWRRTKATPPPEADPGLEAAHPAADAADPTGRDAGAGELPTIVVQAGHLPRIVRNAEAALLTAGVAVYQRGILVKPAEVEYPAADGGITHSAALIPLAAPALLKQLAEVAVWRKWDGRAKALVSCNPPSDVVAILLASRGDWQFPVIRGTLTCPTLRCDGSLLATPGYDERSRYYLAMPAGLVLPAIPDAPTYDDALVSLARLKALLGGYTFVDELSSSVALAMLMTPVLRAAMEVSPLLAVTATAPGTGKSHLVDLTGTIAIGRRCPIMNAGKNDEETEKGINAKLISGTPVFSIDNVHRLLDLAVLNTATERPLITIRRFGTLDDSVEVENGVVIFMTGNNLTIVGEQVRRTILCRMDAGVEQPEQRDFPLGDPISTVRINRARYIADILLIARSYLANGSRPTGMKPFGSYPEWSRLVREPLVWLGQSDPVASQNTARESDPEMTRLRAIITTWYFAFGLGEARTLAEAARFATTPPAHPGEYADADQHHAYNAERAKHEALRDVLRETFPGRGIIEIDTEKLGNWLRHYLGRIADGMKFVKDVGHTGGAVRWKLTLA